MVRYCKHLNLKSEIHVFYCLAKRLCPSSLTYDLHKQMTNNFYSSRMTSLLVESTRIIGAFKDLLCPTSEEEILIKTMLGLKFFPKVTKFKKLRLDSMTFSSKYGKDNSQSRRESSGVLYSGDSFGLIVPFI